MRLLEGKDLDYVTISRNPKIIIGYIVCKSNGRVDESALTSFEISISI
jgi:hypothetical protein